MLEREDSLEGAGGVIRGEVCCSEADILVIPETYFLQKKKLLTPLKTCLSYLASFPHCLRYRQQLGGDSGCILNVYYYPAPQYGLFVKSCSVYHYRMDITRTFRLWAVLVTLSHGHVRGSPLSPLRATASCPRPGLFGQFLSIFG